MVLFSQNNVSKQHLPGRTKTTKCCIKTALASVLQYSTNETAYREIIYLRPMKLKYCLCDTALKDSVIYKSSL